MQEELAPTRYRGQKNDLPRLPQSASGVRELPVYTLDAHEGIGGVGIAAMHDDAGQLEGWFGGSLLIGMQDKPTAILAQHLIP
jgi:hypothetical protein